MKDICILEVSPTGPMENHVEIFETYDWYYVTHNEPLENDEKCINFNKGCRWATNRNYLYDYVKNLETKYKYYLFIDYDVEITSNTDRNTMDQLIHDLNEYNPAVMVINDKTKKDYKTNPDTGVYNFMFSNNHLKIYHYTVLDHFFYLPTFEGCLQLWDACHFNNVNEIPFINYCLCTSNLTCKGLISGEDSNPKDAEERDKLFFSKMQEMHELMSKQFSDKLIQFKTHQDIKKHFLDLSRTLTPEKMPEDVDYMKIVNVKEYFEPFDMKKYEKI